MKRINEFLTQDEKIVRTFKPSFLRTTIQSKIFLLSILLMIVAVYCTVRFDLDIKLCALPVILGIGAMAKPLIECKFTTYILTNKRLLTETGLIGRDYDIVRLDKILDINLDISVVDTIMGTGTIVLAMANELDVPRIKNIVKPKEIVRLINL